ncbi:MAG: response regulator, partial [Pseudomonadota bacterium]
MTPLEDLPLDEQVRILKARFDRAERALSETETALEGRMRELDTANKELSRRESELAERLDIESRQLLTALSTTEMATIYGERGKAFTASEGSANLLGLPEGEVGSLDKLVASIHPLDRTRIMRAGMDFFRTLTPGIDYTFEHRIIRFDTGDVRWLSWVLRREKGGGERPSSVYGTVRDITESRANERAVKALQLRAQRRVLELDRLSAQLTEEQRKTAGALAVRNEFLSEMAHEIRTPLNSLNGGLELLGDTLGPSSKDLAVVQQAADQLMGLASRLIEQAGGEQAPLEVGHALQTGTSGEVDAADGKPKILVAEDTESNRYVIERLLETIGCETVVVGNGVEAIEAVRQQTFDLILMDVMMPIMDGEQATQAIRAMSGPASRTPIIGVTAHSLKAERERLLSAGMTACLPKPVRREALETARSRVRPPHARSSRCGSRFL